MQYSVNSTNGTDGTWMDATATNTTVTFSPGKVYIREKSNPTNFRLVATVTTASAAPVAPTVTKKADGSDNVYEINADTTKEWSIDGTAWTTGTGAAQDVTIPLTGATVSLRTKATDSAIASTASTKIYAAQITTLNCTVYSDTDKIEGLPANTVFDGRISHDGGNTWTVWMTFSSDNTGNTSWGTSQGDITEMKVRATDNVLGGTAIQKTSVIH